MLAALLRRQGGGTLTLAAAPQQELDVELPSLGDEEERER